MAAGWALETGGAFVLTLFSLYANKYLGKWSSAVIYGLIVALVVFIIVTPLFYLEGVQFPYSTGFGGPRRSGTEVLWFVAAQAIGVVAAYTLFSIVEG